MVYMCVSLNYELSMLGKLVNFTYTNDQNLHLTMCPLEVQNAEKTSQTSITANVFVLILCG